MTERQFMPPRRSRPAHPDAEGAIAYVDGAAFCAWCGEPATGLDNYVVDRLIVAEPGPFGRMPTLVGEDIEEVVRPCGDVRLRHRETHQPLR